MSLLSMVSFIIPRFIKINQTNSNKILQLPAARSTTNFHEFPEKSKFKYSS